MVVEVTASEGAERHVGFTDRDEGRPAAESVGERLLGALLDRVHLIAPRLSGRLIAQEARIAGAADVSIHLHALEQVTLQPLTGPGSIDAAVLTCTAISRDEADRGSRGQLT